MIVVRYGTDDVPYDANTAITVGTFDGVHCGHQGLIRRMQEVAMPNGSRTVVVTFEPHPQIILQKPGRPPVELLTTLEERCEVLEKHGVDMVVVIPFSKAFASTPPEEFIRNVVSKSIGVRHFFIGHDHNFGKDRKGDEILLQSLGEEIGFSVETIGPLSCDGLVVSSTKVRHELSEGDVVAAARMLGRRYSLTGVVVRGAGRGRGLGFATANIKPLNSHKLMPGSGVYAVTAMISGREERGMANIGVRPTFENGTETTLEVHFLDLDRDLYNMELRVTFWQFLRAEQKFESKEALLEQLERDRIQTQELQFTIHQRSDT